MSRNVAFCAIFLHLTSRKRLNTFMRNEDGSSSSSGFPVASRFARKGSDEIPARLDSREILLSSKHSFSSENSLSRPRVDVISLPE